MTKQTQAAKQQDTWNYRKGTSPHYQGQISSETTGKTIAITYNDEQGDAARLIAAAPELLKALEATVFELDGFCQKAREEG